MIAWMTAHLWTILLTLILSGIVAAILVGIIRDKRKGKHPSCGCGCGGCPMRGACGRTDDSSR